MVRARAIKNVLSMGGMLLRAVCSWQEEWAAARGFLDEQNLPQRQRQLCHLLFTVFCVFHSRRVGGAARWVETSFAPAGILCFFHRHLPVIPGRFQYWILPYLRGCPLSVAPCGHMRRWLRGYQPTSARPPDAGEGPMRGGRALGEQCHQRSARSVLGHNPSIGIGTAARLAPSRQGRAGTWWWRAW